MAITTDGTDEHDIPADAEAPEEAEPLADDEVLLEEISIDGMCGVY